MKCIPEEANFIQQGGATCGWLQYVDAIPRVPQRNTKDLKLPQGMEWEFKGHASWNHLKTLILTTK